MTERLSLIDKYYRYRSTYWHYKRLWFPSPLEVRFMRLMGARVLTLELIKFNSNFPASIVISRGKILRKANMRRDVRYGRYYVDFANDLNWVIEVDGAAYHVDVVADFDREVYIKNFLSRSPFGMRLLRVPAYRIINNPAQVRADVLKFLQT